MLYNGTSLSNGSVSLCAPDAEEVRASQSEPEEWGRWLDQAITDDGIVYFSVRVDRNLVGEIFLHDVSPERDEAMLGYHIFEPEMRGRGVGRLALCLLLSWLGSHPTIERLFVTTGEDNLASRRLLEGAGLTWIGRPRESASHVLYLWGSPRP